MIITNILWFFWGISPSLGFRRPPFIESRYIQSAFKGSSSFRLCSLISMFPWYYPPLVYWASIPFTLSRVRVSLLGFLKCFLFLFVVSVYQIGKELITPKPGLFRAFCIGMFPITCNMDENTCSIFRLLQCVPQRFIR